jgi:murein DD-endopeptidase
MALLPTPTVTSMRTAAPWLLYGLLSASLGLNLFMVLDRPAPDLRQLRKAQPAPAAVAADSELPAEADPVAVPVEIIAASAAIAEPAGDWTVTQITLEHSLARSFTKAVGGHGDALSAVYARMFHWDIDLRRDLYKGDRIAVAWQLVDGMPEIAAATLQSGKLGRTLSGYRWTRPGDPFPGHWDRDGQARGRRLKQSPLEHYVQITGLLKDRPNHKGMDFKTPIGTPILATRSGTVTRFNWNTAANGGCVEVQFSDGTLAKYLHLSGVSVRPGQRVAAGQVIGKTGNTGRTTAPHLHYQLNRGASVVDPVAFHGTTRRALNPGEMHAFQSDVARLDALLGNALARR